MRATGLIRCLFFFHVISWWSCQLSQVAGDDERSTKVTVLMASTKLAFGVSEDVSRFESIFNTAKVFVPAELKGVDFDLNMLPAQLGVTTRTELLRLIDAPDVTPSTTLVCYLKLHGGCDSQGNHFMQLDGEGTDTMVSRDEIMNRMRARKARLTVLITDSCSSGPIQPIRGEIQAAEFPSRLFADLFLVPKDVVDINSSSSHLEGKPVFESAWMDADGGLFSRTFAAMLSLQPADTLPAILEKIDSNKNKRYSWEEFFPNVVVATDKEFQIFKSDLLRRIRQPRGLLVDPITLTMLSLQEHQTPRSFGQLPAVP